MKGKSFVLIIVALSLFIPFKVFAAGTFRVSVKCNNVEVGASTKCTLTGTSSGTDISSFHGKINVTNATFESFQTASGWLGEGSNGVIDLYTDTMKTGTFSIGTITLKTSSVGSASITLSGIEASDSNFENISGINNATGSFKILDHVTTTTTTKKITTATQTRATERVTSTTTQYIAPLKLTSLTVDDFNVTYENEIYYVTVNQDTTEVNINATAGAGITIIGLGKRTLSDGKNVVDLVLKNEFDQTATINVVITKPEGNKDIDTKLSSLKVVNYDFTFNPETLSYSITVPYNVKEIYIMALPKSEDVVVKNAGLQVLSKGKNTIVVTSSYGDLSETKYTINIKRNYTSLIFIILFSMTSLSFGLYAFFTRKKKGEVKDEVVKEIADEKRENLIRNTSVQASINGENSIGVGRRVVIPTKVINSHNVNERENLINSTPSPQVKVIKTINTNGINRQVINNKEQMSENHE